jgi:peroxiredoxin
MLGWTQRFSGTQLALIFGGSALFLLLVLNLWMMLQILKQNGRTLLRVEALEAGAGLPAPISALPPAPALLQAPGPGEAAPEVELPDLNGEKVDLKSFLGKPAFLLFWNPGCGFCQKMLDRVKAWENNGATDLLVISTGSVEANRAQGFRSSVVLDTDFSAGNAFGASGTPSAIKISAEGRVASLVAVGADDVMRLLS